jgi:hypothetical protein
LSGRSGFFCGEASLANWAGFDLSETIQIETPKVNNLYQFFGAYDKFSASKWGQPKGSADDITTWQNPPALKPV